MTGLCKVCGGAIFWWYTPSMFDDSQDVVCSHYFRPDDEHEAVPMDAPERVLMCSKCGQAQVMDGNWWHCEFPQCSWVDKA